MSNQGETLYTFTGIAKYQRYFFDGLTSANPALAPGLRKAADLNQVSGELYLGRWHDVGTPDRLRQLQQLIPG